MKPVLEHRIRIIPQAGHRTGYKCGKQDAEKPPAGSQDHRKHHIQNSRKKLDKTAIVKQAQGMLIRPYCIHHTYAEKIQCHHKWDFRRKHIFLPKANPNQITGAEEDSQRAPAEHPKIGKI